MTTKRRARRRRTRFTHLEIRRGSATCLRIAVAEDVMPEIGEELGWLVRKLAPIPPNDPVVNEAEPEFEEPELLVTREHLHARDADAYHADLRTHLSALFESLCDSSLADALEIARVESARRAEGGN